MRFDHPALRAIHDMGISQSELARRIGKSKQFVSDMVRGKSRPSDETKLLIVAVTEGRVTFEQLVTWRAARKAAPTGSTEDPRPAV